MIIGFSTRKSNLLSRFIKWMMGAKFSHTFLIFNVSGVYLLLEAGNTGVTIDNLSHYAKSSQLVKKLYLKLPPEQELAVTQAGLKRLDEPYNFFGLIGFLFVLLQRKLGWKQKNPLDVRGSVFCSQFLVEVLGEAGYLDYKTLDPAAVSPEDLYEKLLKDPNVIDISQ